MINYEYTNGNDSISILLQDAVGTDNNLVYGLSKEYTAVPSRIIYLNITYSEPPPVDTCTCAGLDTNWEVNMSDFCELNSACELGTGMLNFTGSGYANCSANINTTNLGDPGALGILYVSSDCLINVKG